MGQLLVPGDLAPGFKKPSTDGTTDLAELRGQWVVLFFYPADFTSGCTQEACDFRDLHVDLDATVLGISPDPVDSHDKFRVEHSLPYPLVADEDHAVANSYGAWGKKERDGRTYDGLIRSTFIVDPEGRVAEAMYNVTATGHAEKVKDRLADLRA